MAPNKDKTIMVCIAFHAYNVISTLVDGKIGSDKCCCKKIGVVASKAQEAAGQVIPE
jgi:hypothetical protein